MKTKFFFLLKSNAEKRTETKLGTQWKICCGEKFKKQIKKKLRQRIPNVFFSSSFILIFSLCFNTINQFASCFKLSMWCLVDWILFSSPQLLFAAEALFLSALTIAIIKFFPSWKHRQDELPPTFATNFCDCVRVFLDFWNCGLSDGVKAIYTLFFSLPPAPSSNDYEVINSRFYH